MADWILQCNPRVWDFFAWWDESDELLSDWVIFRHLHAIGPGDRFALWIGGAEAGVYAMGRVASAPYEGESDDQYWRQPRGVAWRVKLDTERYLFDRPIYKTELLRDPDFADALIIRMPRTGNPIPVTAKQWMALARHRRGGTTTRPTGGEIRVSRRPVGAAIEDSTVVSTAVERVRRHRESQLVKRYEKSLNHPLTQVAVRLGSGERLVADAFDEAANLLVEAKATSTRQDIRMAIGQLMDYRRHLAPRNSRLGVLVPNRPSDDLLDLLRKQKIQVIYETKSGHFRAVR
jgi:hypothetical protein